MLQEATKMLNSAFHNTFVRRLSLYLHDCVREEVKSSTFRNLRQDKDNKWIFLNEGHLLNSDPKAKKSSAQMTERLGRLKQQYHGIDDSIRKRSKGQISYLRLSFPCGEKQQKPQIQRIFDPVIIHALQTRKRRFEYKMHIARRSSVRQHGCFNCTYGKK